MTNPDFVALAKAMNVHAIRCDSLTDLPAKMKEFMDYDNSKPVLLEARVSKVSRFVTICPFSPLTWCSLVPLDLPAASYALHNTAGRACHTHGGRWESAASDGTAPDLGKARVLPQKWVPEACN